MSCNNNSQRNGLFFAGQSVALSGPAIKDGRAPMLLGNVVRLRFELLGPIRAAPIPRHSETARITRAYKLRQQPVEALGAWTARGSFL
jgi:hypothetical protein